MAKEVMAATIQSYASAPSESELRANSLDFRGVFAALAFDVATTPPYTCLYAIDEFPILYSHWSLHEL